MAPLYIESNKLNGANNRKAEICFLKKPFAKVLEQFNSVLAKKETTRSNYATIEIILRPKSNMRSKLCITFITVRIWFYSLKRFHIIVRKRIQSTFGYYVIS